jgi:hypothetical protein
VSDDAGLAPQEEASIKEFEFRGDSLIAVMLQGEGVVVPTRVVCDALGLDAEAQARRLREHAVLSRGLRIVRVPVQGRVRSVLAIHQRYIGFWLATIPPNQVGDAVREKLIAYQLELVEIISRIFSPQLVQPPLPAGGDSLTTALQQRLIDALAEVRLAREALLAAQHETQSQLQSHEARLSVVEGVMDDLQSQLVSQPITAAQQAVIKTAIQHLASRYRRKTGQDIFARLFTQFCVDLGTPKYALLPAGKYEDALDWLRRQAATLLPGDRDALPPLQEPLL